MYMWECSLDVWSFSVRCTGEVEEGGGERCGRRGGREERGGGERKGEEGRGGEKRREEGRKGEESCRSDN